MTVKKFDANIVHEKDNYLHKISLDSSKKTRLLNTVEASAHQISKDLAFTTLIPGHIAGDDMKYAMMNATGIAGPPGAKLPVLNKPIYDYNGRNLNPESGKAKTQ
jgi:hypothetical protein